MARILLDTNILIDSILFPDRLSDKAKQILADENNTIFISSASLLEISIKHSKHPKLMPIDSVLLAKIIADNGFDIFPITEKLLTVLEDIMLEGIHNDPFDHLLLSTAVIEKCSLLTKDRLLAQYKNGNTIIV